ncbi:hypothetical protein EVG20_g7758 [Dentipellis fragilis]|uniref:Uncharacterized protein n=1 Tax=Dentipellis fragilis TaxID=205917 RepID=A0A4Y9YAM6_9AGAM|nr:hypothetical protein EVG20_g7758 [Dentipellis fragilis]
MCILTQRSSLFLRRHAAVRQECPTVVSVHRITSRGRLSCCNLALARGKRDLELCLLSADDASKEVLLAYADRRLAGPEMAIPSRCTHQGGRSPPAELDTPLRPTTQPHHRLARPLQTESPPMSVNFNPYVQGWANAGNAPSGSGQPWGYGGQPPSVFGALPSFNSTIPKLPPPSEFVMYHITGFSPTILNASVVGPRGQTHLRIITDLANPHHTIWRDAQRRTVAMVDWGTRSTVEMPGLLARQSVRSWLRLSSDRTYVTVSPCVIVSELTLRQRSSRTRTMEVRGMQYTWAPSISTSASTTQMDYNPLSWRGSADLQTVSVWRSPRGPCNMVYLRSAYSARRSSSAAKISTE